MHHLIYLLDMHRRMEGLTYAELGRRAKMAKNRVWTIFRNKTSPRLDTVEKLAAALGLRLEFGDMGNAPVASPIQKPAQDPLTEPTMGVCSNVPGHEPDFPQTRKPI